MELGWGQGRRGQRTRSQHIGGPQGSRAEGEGRAQHREADDTALKSARWVRTRWSPGTGVVPTPWPVAVLPGVPGLGGPGPHPSPGAQALCFLRTSWNLGLRSSPGSGLSRPAPTEGPRGEGLRARLLRAPVPMGGNCPEPGCDRWEAGPSGAWGTGGPAAWAPSSRAVGLTASRAPGGPSASVFDLETITRLLLRPGVLPVFLIRVVCAFPFGESRSLHGYDRATALPVPLPCVLRSCLPLSQPRRSHPPGEGRPWPAELRSRRPPLRRSPEARSLARGAVPPSARGPLGRGPEREAEGRGPTALGRLLRPAIRGDVSDRGHAQRPARTRLGAGSSTRELTRPPSKAPRHPHDGAGGLAPRQAEGPPPGQTVLRLLRREGGD